MDEHTITVRPPVWALLLAVTIAGGFYIAGKHIETDPEEEATITISGEGKVMAVPDVAEVSFGVQTGPQKTVQVAMEKLKKGMQGVIDAMEKQGVEEKDIRTEYFNAGPVYDWSDGEQKLRGYEASQSVRVKVRDLDKLGMIVSAATTEGANQAGGVNFTVDEPEALREEARAKAIEDAKRKAVSLADQLNESLGELKAYSEGGWGGPPILYKESYARGAVAGDAAMAPTPLPPGEEEIVVNVTLTYELD